MPNMTPKTTSDDTRRRTTMMPVTTMEEIPVLTEQERTVLRKSLEDAEARSAAGKAVDYDRKSFKERLVKIYRGSKR